MKNYRKIVKNMAAGLLFVPLISCDSADNNTKPVEIKSPVANNEIKMGKAKKNSFSRVDESVCRCL